MVRTSVSQEAGIAQHNDVVSVGWLGMLSRPEQEGFSSPRSLQEIGFVSHD